MSPASIDHVEYSGYVYSATVGLDGVLSLQIDPGNLGHQSLSNLAVAERSEDKGSTSSATELTDYKVSVMQELGISGDFGSGWVQREDCLVVDGSIVFKDWPSIYQGLLEGRLVLVVHYGNDDYFLASVK